MKITGVTIIRNAIINDYPVVASIQSILPIVDEMIVSVGQSEDETEALIRSIASDKIKIVHTVWDPQYFIGGSILAVETDKAIQHVAPDTSWVLYLQADELIHEKYHTNIVRAAQEYASRPEVEGLLFSYLHFYGTYDFVGDSRKWYRREIRMIRHGLGIKSYKDAQGFRLNDRKLKVVLIDAFVYHYGWVKSPVMMRTKYLNLGELWQESIDKKAAIRAQDVFDFSDFDSLIRFTGTHPAVMQKRISEQNWKVDLDIGKKKFSLKNKCLYLIEKWFHVRLFEYRNYTLLKR